MSNMTEWSSRSRGEVASTLLLKLSERKMITWHEMWQSLQPHHCIVWQWHVFPNRKTFKKWKNDIVIFNGNVLGHAWHTWCKKGTNGKRMSCSLKYVPCMCHMCIFKISDFRTMGLWKWITFFDMHCTWNLVHNWFYCKHC